MKIIILCSLLMSATAYHGGQFIKHTTSEIVPNIKQIDQAPSGGPLKPENDIEVNLQSTNSPDFLSSQNDIEQNEENIGIDPDILQLIFGSDNVTEIESSTKPFSEADLIALNCSESTQHNVNKENSGVGQIDVRFSNKNLCFQNILEPGQYGQGFKPSTQTQGATKQQFDTSSNKPYGSEDNPNVGYNSVGFSSTTDLIASGQNTDGISTTPSSQDETKGNQPNRPKNQGGQSNKRPTYPVFRPVNQDGTNQPGVNPSYPNTKPGYQGGNSQLGVNPTYSITRPGNQGGGSQPGITPTYPSTRPGIQGGNSQLGANPTHSITRSGNQDGGSQPGITPTYPNTRPENHGGSTRPGLNQQTHSTPRPSKNDGSKQARVPPYPIYQPGSQSPVYWPNIQIGVNPTAGPVDQGGVQTIISGYWPYVQYGAYYSPDFVPVQGDFGHQGWIGHSQGYLYGYPQNGLQYGWPYTQDPFGYGNGWLGFGGQEARHYNHNQDGFNGQQHQHSHHHHHQPGGQHHGYHFHYNHNRGY